MRAALLFVLVLLSAVLAVLQAVRSPLAADLGRAALIRYGSQLLGEDLFIERLVLAELAPLRIRLDGLTIHSRDPEQRGLPLLRVDALEVAIDSSVDPRERRVPIESIEVQGAAVRVALERGRPRDFVELVARLQRARPKSRDPVRVELGRLDVTGLDLRLSLAPADIGISVHGFEANVVQDSEGMGNGVIQARDIEVVAGPIREHLRVEPGHFRIENGLVFLEPQAVAMRTGTLHAQGEIRLPPPPGSDLPGFSYDIEANTSIDLPRLNEALPTLPPLLGGLDVRATISGSTALPQVSFEIDGQGLGVRIGKRREKLMQIGDIVLRGYWWDDVVGLTRSIIYTGGGEVGLEGELLLDDTLSFRADVDLHRIQLEELLFALTVPRSFVSMRVDGTARLQGRLRGFRAEGVVDATTRELIVDNGPWNDPKPKNRILRVPYTEVRGPVLIEADHCLLGPVTIRGRGSEIVASADFIYQKPVGLRIVAPKGRLDLRDIDGRIANLSLLGQGAVEGVRIVGPANRLEIKGRLDIDDLVLTRWPLGRVSGDVSWTAREDLELRNLRGRRGRSDFQGDVVVRFPNLRRGGARTQTEIGIDVEVPEGRGYAEDLLPAFFGDAIPVKGPAYGTAHLDGPPQGLSGEAEVRGTDLWYLGEHFSRFELDATVNAGTLGIRRAFAFEEAGQPLFARGTIAPSAEGAQVDIELRAPSLNLGSLEAVPAHWGGVIEGSVLVRGALRRPIVRGDARLLALSYRGAALGDGRLRLDVEDQHAVLRGSALGEVLSARAQVGLDGLRPYSFAVDLRGLRLDPFLPSFVQRNREVISAGVDATLRGEGTLRDRWHELALNLDRLWLARGEQRLHNPEGVPIRIAFDDGAVRFDGVHLIDGGGTDLHLDGWLRPAGPLDLRARGPIDPRWLELTGDHWERFDARHLGLSELRASGTVHDLDLSGAIEIDDALVRTRFFPETTEIDSARISLRGRRLTLESFEGRLGGGRLHGAAGSTIQLDPERWVPRDYDLSARCTDCTVRYPSFLPPARGHAQLTFRGTAPDDLVLGGRIDVDEMVLREPINWQRSVLSFRQKATESLAKKDQKALFAFDLYVDSAVEGIRIANNLGEIRGRATDLHIGGDTHHAHVSGQIDISGGAVRYSGHEFTLEPGTALFRSRTTWFPDVVLSMWTDVRSSGENYRVSYTMTGPLDRMRFAASSSPPLPEKDIHSLLLFGLTEEQLAQADLGDFVKSAASVGIGTYATSVAVATTEDDAGAIAARLLRPDRVEVLPVYTDTTGTTSLWAVLTKEVVPDLVVLEGGIGLFGTRTTRVNWVSRARIHFLKNVVLEGSWIRDDLSTQDYGNFALDMKLEFDAE